jgi:hypothetical protein
VVLVFAGSLFFSLALMVATFRSTRMASVVGSVIVIQQIVVVLQQASKELPESAAWLINVINLLAGTLRECSLGMH